MTRRRSFAAVIGAALLAVLMACTPDIPDVSPDPQPQDPEPVLEEARLERVLDDIEDTIEAADAEHDEDLLAERMENPALQVRESEYRLREATADAEEQFGLQPLTTAREVAIVAATEEWPRDVFVVTEIPDDANTHLLIGLRQQDPRSQYKMFSWVRLLPGVTTPEADDADIGSPPVDPEDEDFLTSPAQALERYADLLTEGEDSEFADLFDQDPFSELVQQEATTLADNVEAAGEFSHGSEVNQDATVAMRTANGGAVVFGALQTQQTFTRTEAEGEVEVGGGLAALSEDDGVVNESLQGTYDVMVALYVPTDQQDAHITVLGAERVLSSVDEE